jgi:dihydrolipoamide dehydrogenase
MEIKEGTELGIRAEITDIDFSAVMERMRSTVTSGRNSIRNAIEESENLDFINRAGYFIDERTLAAGNEKIRGKKIFIASGTRPLIPPIKGLDTIRYLTNESVLEIEKRPDSLIMIGGGYVGLDHAHSFRSSAPG